MLRYYYMSIIHNTTINASKLSYSIYYKNLPSLIVTRKYTHQLFPDTFQNTMIHTLLLVGETVSCCWQTNFFFYLISLLQ